MNVVLKSDFLAFPPLRGPHAQTIWAAKFRSKPLLKNIEWEKIELPDGDFIDLVWMKKSGRPTIVILHGLEGSYQSSTYVKCLMQQLEKRNLQSVLIHFRGCGQEINRLPRSYHAGDTQDLDLSIQHIKNKIFTPPFAIIGYSLGGNVLLKWLAEKQPKYLKTAVAVSVPFDLSASADHLSQGLSRVYQRYLLKSMRSKFLKKTSRLGAFLSVENINSLNSFRLFDAAITAPLHGFSSVTEYYEKASCFPILPEISTDTLIIHAHDDPFLPPTAIPKNKNISSSTTLEITPHGGHVGFIGTSKSGTIQYWLEDRIIAHIESFL